MEQEKVTSSTAFMNPTVILPSCWGDNEKLLGPRRMVRRRWEVTIKVTGQRRRNDEWENEKSA